MTACTSSSGFNFRALLSIDSGANLVNSKQAIGVILPDLSLLGYAVPVESFGIGLFIVLFAYLVRYAIWGGMDFMYFPSVCRYGEWND